MAGVYTRPQVSVSTGGAVSIQPGKLFIGNTNVPCCNCEDYEAVYNALTEQYSQAVGAGASFGSIGFRIRDPEDPTFGPSSINDINGMMERVRKHRHKRRFYPELRAQAGNIVGVKVMFHNNPPNWPYRFSKSDGEFKIQFSCGGGNCDPDFLEGHYTRILPSTVAVYYDAAEEHMVEQWYPADIDEVFIKKEDADYIELPELLVQIDKALEHAPHTQLGLVPPSHVVGIYFEVAFEHPDIEEGTEILVDFISSSNVWESPQSYQPLDLTEPAEPLYFPVYDITEVVALIGDPLAIIEGGSV